MTGRSDPIVYHKSLRANGYVFLPHFRPGEATYVVANSIGEISELPNVSVIQRIRPKRIQDSIPNLYSGNYGLNAFPLHTDLAHWYLPPRYLLLRCAYPASEVSTLLLPAEDALRAIDRLMLHRAIYRPRRKLRGRLALLRLLQKTTDGVLFRWDQLFLEPASPEGATVANHLRNPSLTKEAIRVSFDQPYDTLIVDNWAMLHGRSAVPQTALRRVVDRVYLQDIK